MRILLILFHSVLSNANGNSVDEISERTGIKPSHVRQVISLLSDLGFVEKRGNIFHIIDAETDIHNLFENMMDALEVPSIN
jgi:DNA-binding IclR family transcriptional regulator